VTTYDVVTTLMVGGLLLALLLLSNHHLGSIEKGRRAEAFAERVLRLEVDAKEAARRERDEAVAALALSDHEASTAASTSARIVERQAGQIETLSARVAELTPPERVPVTKEELNVINANRCDYCGGSHAVACPRVKSIRYRGDGRTPMGVEFWADAEWPKDRVTYLEDILPPAEEPVTG